MNASGLPSKVTVGDLIIEVKQCDAGVISLDWRGKSNHSQPEALLSVFFSSLTRSALLSRSRIKMHFDELDFFNSATIAAVIKYIKELRERQVPLAVTYNSNHKWQRIFFDALWIFVKEDGLLTITAAK